LQPNDIRLAFLSPVDAKAVFVSGSIDAWATWSPYVYLAVARDKARIPLDGRGLMSEVSYQVASERAIPRNAISCRPLRAGWKPRCIWGLANVAAIHDL